MAENIVLRYLPSVNIGYDVAMDLTFCDIGLHGVHKANAKIYCVYSRHRISYEFPRILTRRGRLVSLG